MNRSLPLLPAFAVLLLAACAGPQVEVDYDEVVGLGGRRSWAFAEPAWSAANPRDPNQASDLLHARVRTALEDGLARRNFVPVPDRVQAELLVSWQVARRIRQGTLNRTAFGPPHAASDPDHVGPYVHDDPLIYNYEVEFLTLMLRDPAGRTVWQATMQNSLSGRETPAAHTQRIRQAVETMLERLPQR